MPNFSTRTLFIAMDLPYPPRGGAPLRNWQNINILRQYGEVAIFSVFRGKPPKRSLPEISVWNHHNLSQKRLLRERIRSRLSFLTPWQYPYFDAFYPHAALAELEKTLAQFKPNLIILEHLWICRYIPMIKQYSYPIILDQHNVEFDLFKQRNIRSQSIYSNLQNQMYAAHIKYMEKQAVRSVDRVWVCSQSDAKLTKDLYGKHLNPSVVPNGINVLEYDSVRLNHCSLPDNLTHHDRTLIFMGAFAYTPNVEAAQFLIDLIYPQLKTIYPDCQLLLVGKEPPQNLQNAAQACPGIICTGTVPDIKPYLMAASIVVTPLFQGGGTRLKILEAFAAKRPVISTTKGAEGLKAIDGEHLLIRDEADSIVAAICQLWSNPELGQKLAENAYNLVCAEYSWEAVSRKVEPLIEELFSSHQS